MSQNKINEIGKGDRHLVPSFFNFTKRVFPSADFEKWYKHGYWTGEYLPHVYISGGKVVSNVSATLMDVFINGQRKKGVQIGTVGTIPEERNKGLSRLLMNHVLARYKNEAELFFLFANESVLDFYPKFGFHREYETIYQISTKKGECGRALKKIDLCRKGDRHLINRILINRTPLTKFFGSENHESITWWHLLNVYKDDIYFWEEEDILLIMYPWKKKLKLIDVMSTKPPAPEKLINEISGFGDTDSIIFCFPPDQVRFPHDKMIRDEDTMFFIKGDFNPGPGFKFPVTAQT